MNQLLAARSLPLVYVITDRKLLPANQPAALTEFTHRAIDAGADMIQIRERDLTARQLLALVETANQAARPRGAIVLVNDRSDIAASAGAGVHLTTRSLDPRLVRRLFGSKILVGASTHNLSEAVDAEKDGADFIVFGPVFETAAKRIYRPPVGLDALKNVASQVNLPVIALGGIALSNFHLALDAGASGIAGISMFVGSDLVETVRAIKGHNLGCGAASGVE